MTGWRASADRQTAPCQYEICQTEIAAKAMTLFPPTYHRLIAIHKAPQRVTSPKDQRLCCRRRRHPANAAPPAKIAIAAQVPGSGMGAAPATCISML